MVRNRKRQDLSKDDDQTTKDQTAAKDATKTPDGGGRKPDQRHSRTNFRNIIKVPNDQELTLHHRYQQYLDDDKKPDLLTFRNKPNLIHVLIVAEKSSVASRIAGALEKKFGTKKFRLKKFRFKKFLIYFEIEGIFQGCPALFIITGLQGHVSSRDFPKKYSEWTSCEPIYLFDAETSKYGVDYRNRVVETLEYLAYDIDIVQFWLDNDMEGESICFEVIDVIYNIMNIVDFKQFYRYRFSSLEFKDIIKAFSNKPKQLDVRLALACEAKHIFDLKVGVAFTRQLTNNLAETLKVNRKAVVSFGPCQNPTMALVIERELEIERFVPQKYYVIAADVVFNNNKKVFGVYLDNENTKFNSKEEAEEVRKRIKGNAFIDSIGTRIEEEQGPAGLNTLRMLKYATMNLGIGSGEAMAVAQRLYMKGMISYPRTETTDYGDHNFTPVVEYFSKSKDKSIQSICTQLLTKKELAARQGEDFEEHTPIMPTMRPSIFLEGKYKCLYDFIMRYYLAGIADKSQVLKQDVSIKIGEFEFIYQSSSIENEGFKSILEQDIAV